MSLTPAKIAQMLTARIARLRETAEAAGGIRWDRSHSAIIGYTTDPPEPGKKYGRTHGYMIALAESDLMKKGHGSFEYNPLKDAPNTRHIVANNPYAILELLKHVERVTADYEANLARANRIIGWMAPSVGSMCPPDGGLAELNEHFMENVIPEPGAGTKGAPLKQAAVEGVVVK